MSIDVLSPGRALLKRTGDRVRGQQQREVLGPAQAPAATLAERSAGTRSSAPARRVSGTDGPRRRARATSPRSCIGLLALVSWAFACATMEPADYTDLGLISAATPWFWLALAGGIGSFTCALRARHFHGRPGAVRACWS